MGMGLAGTHTHRLAVDNFHSLCAMNEHHTVSMCCVRAVSVYMCVSPPHIQQQPQYMWEKLSFDKKELQLSECDYAL